MSSNDDSGGLSEGLAILISSIVGIVVAVASVWYVSDSIDSSTETLYRINPTEESPAVGTDFVAGNTDPLFDALIAVIHLVDVVMGVFILLMVFIHWGAFRRLAARMQEPGGSRDEVATDGGRTDDGRTDNGWTDGGPTDDGRTDDGRADDGRTDGAASEVPEDGDRGEPDGGETP